MGLFNIKNAITNLFVQDTPSAADLSPAEKSLLSKITKINAHGDSITPELYQQLRDFEMNWLERHYDFNSLDGINAIPVSKDLPGAPQPSGSTKGHTGEVYYYLRHKSYGYEEAGKNELALACMRKSVDLVMCRNNFSTDDCYPLVKMLARFGFADEARKVKREIDAAFGIKKIDDSIIKAELKRRQELLDFQWIQQNIPDKCPKSISSYRRIKTQNTKNYQALKQLAAEKGREI